MYQLIDAVEFVTLIGLLNLLLQRAGTFQCPAIQAQHLFRIEQVFFRIEPGEIGKQEAGCITQAAIGLRCAFQNLVRHIHFAAVVCRGHP